jgi:hypothetical protein
VDTQLWATLEHALLLVGEVFAGRRDATDPAYREAKELIQMALAAKVGSIEQRAKLKEGAR